MTTTTTTTTTCAPTSTTTAAAASTLMAASTVSAARAVRLVNLTPHSVTVRGVEVPPSKMVARCVERRESRGTITAVITTADGTVTAEIAVPIVAKRFGEIEGLPEPQEGVVYICSALAAQAAWAIGRRDVVCPGDLVRTADGAVVGAASLCVAP